MRHIEDLEFELSACLDRARKIKDVALENGLLFSLLTLNELEKTLKEGGENE
jgi:hypothetical protein